MSPLKRIICLANSWKLEERCIAGIDIDTGRWIRPVCDSLYPENGKVPRAIRLIEGKEPELLDILEIPLAEIGNDFGFECENLSILAGQWRYLGKAQPTALLKYCDSFTNILHTSWKYVNPSYLINLPFHQRRTLQLVQVDKLSVEQRTSSKGNLEWRCTIQSSHGQRLTGAKITDPVFVEKLEAGYKPKEQCLVTVSLSIPWAPPDWDGEIPCWKLIAGVIEI
ncbi:dual OB domain-containing protein [Pantanalinema rosaneae CENA516]|uniref:dual OB domain-containing protein n=1 Tax=Pantanalinema rosaneae TaxID=1620701 RepID=UPI003D6F00A6